MAQGQNLKTSGEMVQTFIGHVTCYLCHPFQCNLFLTNCEPFDIAPRSTQIRRNTSAGQCCSLSSNALFFQCMLKEQRFSTVMEHEFGPSLRRKLFRNHPAHFPSKGEIIYPQCANNFTTQAYHLKIDQLRSSS